MNDYKQINNLKPSKLDYVHTTVKTGLSMIPVIGSPASELFSNLITPPLTKRREEWVSSVVETLQELENKYDDFKLENLANNELFLTIVMQATQIAIRNHTYEKIEALRNAVSNCAMKIKIDEDMQIIFLNYVDSLTPSHIKILKFFIDPIKYYEENGLNKDKFYMGTPFQVIEYAYPELCSNKEYFNKLIKDLFYQGLLSSDSLNTMMSLEGMFASRTTNMGTQFIKYITE